MSRSLLLKRLVSVCLVLLFAAATLDCASSDDSLFSMQSLGIMDKIGEKSPAAYATRAEFAQMVVNLLQYQDIAEQTEPADYFTEYRAIAV